ncbi:uncharacterized protein LOC144450756 [Glandiceps talaboti]
MGDWAEKQRLREEIIEAVKLGDAAGVERLLNNGADVNESEGGYLSKKNLLMMAIYKKYVDVAVLLVKRGIDLSFTAQTVDKEEKTALDLAREHNLNEVTDLIERTSEANHDLSRAVTMGITDLASRALDAGGNINMLIDEGSQHGGSLLMIAICSEHKEMAKFLIHRGINLDYVNKWDDPSSGEHQEDTARDYASKMQYSDIVQLIDDEKQKRKENQAKVTANGQGNNMYTHTQTQKHHANGDLQDVEDFEDEEEIIQKVDKDTKKKKRKSAGSSSCVIF